MIQALEQDKKIIRERISTPFAPRSLDKPVEDEAIFGEEEKRNLASGTTNTQSPTNDDHLLSSLDKGLIALSKNSSFNKSIDFVSLLSLVSLFASSFLEAGLTKASKSLVSGVSNVADYANKTFQIINSIKNITSLYPRKDYINVLGHAIDVVLPFFVKMKDFYLARGLALGTYVGAHAINIMNEKESFKSISEYKDHLTEAFRKTMENFFTSPKVFLQRLGAHRHAMIGVLSSVFCLGGFALWKPLELILGHSLGRKIVTAMRDLGGLFQSIEGMKPGHMVSGRIFFGFSGYSQCLGAICNFLAETVLAKYKSALDPLSFAFSSLGRWLYRISNDRGEAGYKNVNFNWREIGTKSRIS